MTNKEMLTLIQNTVDDAEVKTFAAGVLNFLTENDDIAEATKHYVQNKEESAVIAILENSVNMIGAKIVAEKMNVSVPKASAILRRLVNKGKATAEKVANTHVYSVLS